MTSLKTILECSEVSEREFDSASRLFFKKPLTSGLSNLGSNNNILTASTLHNPSLLHHTSINNNNHQIKTHPVIDYNGDDNDEVEDTEETSTVKHLMKNLDLQTFPKCLHPLTR